MAITLRKKLGHGIYLLVCQVKIGGLQNKVFDFFFEAVDGGSVNGFGVRRDMAIQTSQAMKNLIGQAMLMIWPLNRIGLIP